MPDTLTLIADFRARPGQGGRLRTELLAMVAPSEAEPGCRGYRPLDDPARPDTMVCLEEWEDEAALQFHFGTPHFRHVAQVFEDLLAEPFKLRRLVGPDGGRAA